MKSTNNGFPLDATFFVLFDLSLSLLGLTVISIYVYVIITTLDINCRPVFYLKTQRFGDWIPSSSSDGT
jgi:hypothetical protein